MWPTIFLVFAWSDLEKKQRDPVRDERVHRRTCLQGVLERALTEKWGILAGNTGFFKMEDVEVPAENLVDREAEDSRSRCCARPGPLHRGVAPRVFERAATRA